MISCFWNGEGKDSQYKHISELTEDDFLNVKELDQDYDYDQEYDYDETRNRSIFEKHLKKLGINFPFYDIQFH